MMWLADKRPMIRITEFVRDYITPFNGVILMSTTVASVLDFLAPQAPYLAWVSYALAVLVLFLMALEGLAKVLGAQVVDRCRLVLDRVRPAPGPIWKVPAWQVFSVITVIVIVLGHFSSAHAGGGGVIASAAPTIRNVQVLLLGLQEDTRHIKETLTGVDTKVDAIKESVDKLEAALPPSTRYDSPRDALRQGDYPYLREYVGNGTSPPRAEREEKNDLVLGLNKKRPDRFKLLELYSPHDLATTRLMVLGYRNIAIDETTARNVEKLIAWGKKNRNNAGNEKYILGDCHNNMLHYAYIAGDQELANWLIKNKGMNPTEKLNCGMIFDDHVKEDGTSWHWEWKISANEIRAILSR